MNVGDAIKKLREEMELSQKDFSVLCDISQTYLSQIENNRKTPNFNVIGDISNKTGIPLPVILFLSIEANDVQDNKRESFNMFSPTIHKFIGDIFLSNEINKPKRLEYILGMKLEKINNIIEHINDYYYEDIKIKKNGKKRILYPSVKDLKIIQKRIKSNILEKFDFPPHIQGGIKKRDNISNANLHLGKKYKLITDLKDFFPSINHKQVYDMFIRNGCSPDVSSYLTKLTTYKGELPQGTPTSSHIANIVFIPIDIQILEICAKHKITYTRFIDDLSFSSSIGFKNIVNDIIKIIFHNGFRVNHKKTYYKVGTVEVTGLKVKNNVLDIKDEQKNKLENNELSPESKKGLLNYKKRVKNRGK